MPIIIRDYKWKQTLTDVVITLQVPLKNASQSKIDIFISSRFVKASYEQYYFEVVLYAPIDKLTSKCTLTSSDIIFELTKWEKGEWEYLEPNISKKEKLDLKKQLLEESFKEIQDSDKKRHDKRYELKRLAVKKQIDIDEEHRSNIDNLRNMEEKKALGDLEDFRKKVSQRLKHRQKKAIESSTSPSPMTYNNNKQTSKPEPEIPKTRKTTTVQIDFTQREFPTPCRESMLEEEHVFLAKQAEARRTVGFVSEDIRPEERNPHFIKAKGDEFLKNKNYLGAISAYSYGIKLSKNYVDFYIARSEAHLEAGNFWRAAQDCSTAMELLNPICEANLYERAVCTGRRGEALCNLNMKKQGIDELKFSLKLINQQYYKEILEREEVLYAEQLKKEEEDRLRKLKEEEERLKEKRKTEEEKLKQKESKLEKDLGEDGSNQEEIDSGKEGGKQKEEELKQEQDRQKQEEKN